MPTHQLHSSTCLGLDYDTIKDNPAFFPCRSTFHPPTRCPFVAKLEQYHSHFQPLHFQTPHLSKYVAHTSYLTVHLQCVLYIYSPNYRSHHRPHLRRRLHFGTLMRLPGNDPRPGMGIHERGELSTPSPTISSHYIPTFYYLNT